MLLEQGQVILLSTLNRSITMKKFLLIVLLLISPSLVFAGFFGGGGSGSVSESDISTINHAATEKANLVNADEITGQDSADSFNLIRTTWVSIKAFLKTYFDGLYPPIASPAFTGEMTFAAPTELTIATDIITVTQTLHSVDTQADAATDDLVTINGGADGQVLFLRANNVGRIATLKETGNIIIPLGTELSLVNSEGTVKWVMLYYDAGISKWGVVGALPDSISVGSISLGGIVLGDTTPDAVGEFGYASGKFLFFGANSEDLYLEVGSAANTVAVGSNTGIDTIDLGAINLLTSGTIGSKFPTVAGGAADLSLSVAQVSGTNISNTGQGVNNRNHTLPVAEAGLVFIGSVGEAQGASYYRFTANTTPTPDDFMCLNGTCGKTYVSIAAPTQGAQVMCRTEQIASTGIKTGAALAIGTTNTAVANGAFTFDIGGTGYAKAATAAGTAPGNDVIPQGTFGAVAFDIGADGTIDAVEATDNATGYASAVLAVAGLPAVAAAHTRMGNVTASKSDGTFTFGTTALDAASTTVAYTSSTAYTKPYNWMCNSSVGTWVTD